MSKLLTAFSEAPTVANARRLLAYVRKHPMALCMVTVDEHETIKHAEVVVLDGEG
jgi:hypothetical protein